MATVEANIHGALIARVEHLEADLPISVIYPGPEALPIAGEHIEAHHLPNKNIRRALSSDAPMVRMGILQLNLRSVPGQYEWQYRERAGQIAAYFPLDFAMVQGLSAVTVSRVDVMPGATDETHYRTPIRVYYQGFA